MAVLKHSIGSGIEPWQAPAFEDLFYERKVRMQILAGLRNTLSSRLLYLTELITLKIS
jgi:hypothetical protein